MSTELAKYPDRYWTNNLTHFFTTRAANSTDFRLDEWIRNLPDADLEQLIRTFSSFNEQSEESRQDVILLSSLLFTRETGLQNLTEDTLTIQLIQQLATMSHFESLRRDGLLFIEQRLCIRPDFKPEHLLTLAGKEFVDKYGELPGCTFGR